MESKGGSFFGGEMIKIGKASMIGGNDSFKNIYQIIKLGFPTLETHPIVCGNVRGQ